MLWLVSSCMQSWGSLSGRTAWELNELSAFLTGSNTSGTASASQLFFGFACFQSSWAERHFFLNHENPSFPPVLLYWLCCLFSGTSYLVVNWHLTYLPGVSSSFVTQLIFQLPIQKVEGRVLVDGFPRNIVTLWIQSGQVEWRLWFYCKTGWCYLS